MRVNILGLTVAAVSTLGLTAAATDKARAYVMKNPEGAYAPLALQLIVELESRRLLMDGDGLSLKRRLMTSDLVYRPRDKAKIEKVYGSEDEGSTLGRTRNRNWSPQGGDVSSARRAQQYLEVRSKRFGSEIDSCRRPPPMSLYLACMANAVDTYARYVEEMPATPSSVAPVAAPALRQAARSIRSASTPQEARVAVARVVEEVRKSIDLVQAGGEDTLRRLEISQRSVILNSMATLDASLVQAIGI